MQSPFTKILIKIFANGFYKVHSGLFLFVALVMVGAVPPDKLWMYEKTLMLAFISSPLMAVVFAGWLLYTIKAVHYVAGQIFAVNQQFLFYSSNSFSKKQQFKSWFCMQAVILAPLMVYGLIAVGMAIVNKFYLSAAAIFFYLVLLAAMSALLFMTLVNRLMDGSNQSFILKMSSKWRKPFFSLFVYHVFDKMKLTYLVTKALSWLIITGVFLLFAEAKSDVRVAGIAMLAIITAHAIIIYQEHKFENQYLSFARSMPFSYAERFFNFIKAYFLLLLPEAIWLFSRFNPLIAVELLLLGLSIAMFLHCLLYKLAADMDNYLQWLMGVFIVLFWVIMYRLTWALIPLNLAVAYGMFYKRYYGGESLQ